MVATPPTLRTRLARNELRQDIEGLRALAVTSVVLFHAQIPFLAGGYIGVDVFFVISGFLIGGMIYDEIRVTGRFSFYDFYARRARRILPAAAVVLALVAVVSLLVLPPLRTLAVLRDVLSSLFYVQNWNLAFAGTNYMAEESDASPVQHYWSLSVEEQFYLFWPVLFLLAGVIALRLKSRRASVPFYVVTVIAILASFGYSMAISYTNGPLAYFSVFTRVWQFALGVLIALIIRSFDRTRVPQWLRFMLGFAGLAGIAVSCVTFGADTPYPGLAALVPTLAVGAVIFAGVNFARGEDHRPRAVRALDPSVLLSTPPMRWLGGISYSWYLWHWPPIVLVKFYFPEAPWWILLVPALLALGPAYLSLRYLENPIRHSKTVTRHPLQGISIGLAATLVTLGTFFAVDGRLRAELNDAPQVELTIDAGASAEDPFASSATSGPVAPTVVSALNDVGAHSWQCLIQQPVDDLAPNCIVQPDGTTTAGPPASDRYVLFGDSHADQWAPMVEALAADDNVDLDIQTKVGCPAPTFTVEWPELKRPYVECDQWREKVLSYLEDSPPAAVFIGTLNRYGVSQEELESGWKATLDRLQEAGAHVYYLVDSPYPNTDVPACISGHFDDWSACGFAPLGAILPNWLEHQIANRAFPSVQSMSFNPILCPQKSATALVNCPPVRAGVLLYRDTSHLTATAARTMIPYARALFEQTKKEKSNG